MFCTQYDIQNTQYASRTMQYDTRDTLHASRNSALHLSRKLYKSTLFMQNKANFKNTEMIVTACNINSYGNLIAFFIPKNKAKQTQNEPNFSPKLASFSPTLALFYKEIFAFAKKFNLFDDLPGKNAKHSCGRRIFFRNSLLFKAKNPENTKVSEINPCQSVKSAVKYNFVNPVILSKENQFKILVNRLKIWYNKSLIWNQPMRSEILTQKERKIKDLL